MLSGHWMEINTYMEYDRFGFFFLFWYVFHLPPLAEIERRAQMTLMQLF